MTQNALNNAASVFDVDNIKLDGNTISSTDTNGNVVIAPDGTGDIVTGTTGTANVVSMLRSAEGQWFGMNDQTDSFGIYNTTGTPEGGITANIGSIATDTTNGVIYVKQTDTANTGWVTVGGDSGSVVQISETTSTTAATSAAVIPSDNTIPQITEGTSFMTHSHTPLNTANILQIEFNASGVSTPTGNLVGALFQQGTANAIVAQTITGNGSTNNTGVSYLTVKKVAGSTSSLTFEMRFGPNVATTVGLNGNTAGTHRYGAAGIATLRVVEYLP